MIKIYLIVGLVLSVLGGGGYIVHLIGDRAVKVASFQALEKVMNEQQTISEKIIEAYSINTDALQQKYSNSRQIIDQAQQRGRKHDLQKDINKHTQMVIDRVNRGTRKLFDQFEILSSYPSSTSDPSKTTDPG